MKQLDCKKIRESMLNAAREYTKDRDLTLAIIYDPSNFASCKYVKNKQKTCEYLGIRCMLTELGENITADQTGLLIDAICNTSCVTGVILQLPLPEHLKPYTTQLINRIDWRKDVDGLTIENVGRLWSGIDGVRPATAEAVMRLLPEKMDGKNVLIIGKSDLVGKPLIKMLLDRGATVKSTNSKTSKAVIKYDALSADYVISATGSEIKIETLFGEGYTDQLFIDVGIREGAGGKICGDFVMDHDYPNSDNIIYTPVPGGVGILTTAQIPLNLIKCHKLLHSCTRD